jgi:energy-converting hydrogenase Eha subunit A
VVSRASAAGLVAAGLLSVIVSPALGLVLLRRDQPATAELPEAPTPVLPVMTAEDRALSQVGSAATPA